MRIVLLLIYKEFLQIFRNRTMLPVIFVLPIVQLVILVEAATMDMKKIDYVVVDQDKSSLSKRLVNKIESSPFFTRKRATASVDEARDLMLRNKTDLIVVVPANFERDLLDQGKADIQLMIDAINGMSAGLINGYATSILASFNQEVLSSRGSNALVSFQQKIIDTEYTYWYNRQLVFKNYMVPGILTILVTILGMFLTGLNLVREKEMGTMEQINVTPIKKYQFIVGKLVPFWLIALFDLGFGLLLGKLLYDIPIEGSLFLLFSFASVYLVTALSLGLFLSTVSNTQQQVIFLAFFFMLTFLLMSGIFTPAESMPHWAQQVNVVNPIAYFMRVIRMILLKGSGFHDIMKDMIAMGIYGAAVLSLAIWRYHKIA
jgi:ABC-2 type transport system permease protein